MQQSQKKGIGNNFLILVYIEAYFNINKYSKMSMNHYSKFISDRNVIKIFNTQYLKEKSLPLLSSILKRDVSFLSFLPDDEEKGVNLAVTRRFSEFLEGPYTTRYTTESAEVVYSMLLNICESVGLRDGYLLFAKLDTIGILKIRVDEFCTYIIPLLSFDGEAVTFVSVEFDLMIDIHISRT